MECRDAFRARSKCHAATLGALASRVREESQWRPLLLALADMTRQQCEVLDACAAACTVSVSTGVSVPFRPNAAVAHWTSTFKYRLLHKGEVVPVLAALGDIPTWVPSEFEVAVEFQQSRLLYGFGLVTHLSGSVHPHPHTPGPEQASLFLAHRIAGGHYGAVVLGEPGCGRTTAVRLLACAVGRSVTVIPCSSNGPSEATVGGAILAAVSRCVLRRLVPMSFCMCFVCACARERSHMCACICSGAWVVFRDVDLSAPDTLSCLTSQMYTLAQPLRGLEADTARNTLMTALFFTSRVQAVDGDWLPVVSLATQPHLKVLPSFPVTLAALLVFIAPACADIIGCDSCPAPSAGDAGQSDAGGRRVPPRTHTQAGEEVVLVRGQPVKQCRGSARRGVVLPGLACSPAHAARHGQRLPCLLRR